MGGTVSSPASLTNAAASAAAAWRLSLRRQVLAHPPASTGDIRDAQARLWRPAQESVFPAAAAVAVVVVAAAVLSLLLLFSCTDVTAGCCSLCCCCCMCLFCRRCYTYCLFCCCSYTYCLFCCCLRGTVDSWDAWWQRLQELYIHRSGSACIAAVAPLTLPAAAAAAGSSGGAAAAANAAAAAAAEKLFGVSFCSECLSLQAEQDTKALSTIK